jgi:hypothetical protein
MDDVDSVARSIDRAGAAPGDDGSAMPLPETVRISFLLDFCFERARTGIGRRLWFGQASLVGTWMC